MKSKLPLLCALSFVLFGTPFAQAQFSNFAATNEAVAFGTIFTNGASAQYFLTYSIGTNGVIRGRAVRYDLPANSASASPRKGTALTIVAKNSKLGLPINRTDKWAPMITRRCPLMISLSDGAKIKGVAESTTYPGPSSNFNVSIEGFITYKGSTGSNLSLSNPY